MKPLVFQKFQSSKSLFKRTLVNGLTVWLIIQLPLSILLANFYAYKYKAETNFQRKNLEKILTDNFKRNARYDDILHAREATTALGRPFGLQKVAVCSHGKDLFGKIGPTPCRNSSDTGKDVYSIKVGGKTVVLKFIWPVKPLYTQNVFWISFIFSLIAGFLFTLWIVFLLGRRLSLHVQKFSSELASKENIRELASINIHEKEFEPILQSLIRLAENLETAQNQKLEIIAKTKADRQFGVLARQVSHDIKSPLSALEILSKRINFSTNEEKNLFLMTCKRIYEIADDLLSKSKKNSVEGSTIISSHTIQSIIEEVKAEKELNLPQDVTLKIDVKAIHNVLVVAEESSIRRMLSNILNNAIEAVQNKGLIEIQTELLASFFNLHIIDNGRGISAEKLSRLGNEGESFGKKNGNGIGIWHAKQTLEKWNASLKIESEEGHGTKISFMFPISR